MSMTDITNTVTDSPAQQSPPPSQRPTFEHHHSPVSGQHPDLPGTPARMLAQLDGESSDEAGAATANATAKLLPSAQQQPESNGGARAAFMAAQQQRNVTCNLSLLPPSMRKKTHHLCHISQFKFGNLISLISRPFQSTHTYQMHTKKSD